MDSVFGKTSDGNGTRSGFCFCVSVSLTFSLHVKFGHYEGSPLAATRTGGGGDSPLRQMGLRSPMIRGKLNSPIAVFVFLCLV